MVLHDFSKRNSWNTPRGPQFAFFNWQAACTCQLKTTCWTISGFDNIILHYFSAHQRWCHDLYSFFCGKKWWNTQHWSNNGCLQATHTECEANCFLDRIFLIFSDVGRPSVLTPRFCMIFRDEHDSADRGCNLRAPDRPPIQPTHPATRATSAHQPSMTPKYSLFSINQRITNSLVNNFPNTSVPRKTCMKKIDRSKPCVPIRNIDRD